MTMQRYNQKELDRQLERALYNSIKHDNQHDYISAIYTILKRGAAINPAGKLAMTPLEIAINANCPELVRILINRGADVNKVTSDNKRPLEKAIEKYKNRAHRSDTEFILKLLVHAGARITPMDIKTSKEKKYYAVTRLLKSSVATKLLRHKVDLHSTVQPEGKKLD
jgi:Ankyrin repeats (many copies)